MECYRHLHRRSFLARQTLLLLNAVVFATVSLLLFALQLFGPSGTLDGIVLAALLLIVGAGGSLALRNMCPEICLNEAGIVILSMPGRTVIPWNKVQNVVESRRITSRRVAVICAQQITVLHYIYGWYFLRELRPCLPVDPMLENGDRLVARIMTHVQNAK